MTEHELVERDARHVIHPHLPRGRKERTIFVRGRGCTLWDAGGREYLDATGGLWLAQIGHGRAEMAEAAAAQMRRLEYFTSFWDFGNDRAIELAERLAGLAPAGLEHTYFTSGGSEGNDAAIKTARYYHSQRGEPSRTWILSRTTAYHGLAYGGGTATGFDDMKAGIGPLMPHVEHLTPPHPYRSWLFDGQDPTEFCVAELEATIARLGPGNIAAMIAEPIMGVAGMVVPPEDYWPRVTAVLRRYGILLILDEVVTGFGRVGEWFAADRYRISPDILVIAKGLTSGYAPLGAVMTTSEIVDVVTEGHGYPVGYTYSGHPVSCAVASANLDILEREDLVAGARRLGDHLAAALAPLCGLAVVGEVRHAGLGVAVELVEDKDTRRPLPEGERDLADVIRDETGVIARVSSSHNLVLSPPLVMTESEADRAAEAVGTVLRRVRPDGSVAAA
ncbi:aspartate aminotransferase family protein [Pseudonocardia acaciae]|uniref:aminotransferase family protein n=1 Tax=Pseudonocardia acaciae TaxID=551276 RepID=UPI000490624B|nr:aspartate aminotransferase family protein [Pseudonocardia acaciae]